MTVTAYALDAFIGSGNNSSPKLVVNKGGLLAWAPHNLFYHSEDLTLGQIPSNVTVPTATRIAETTATGGHSYAKSMAAAIQGMPYCFTVEASAAECDRIMLYGLSLLGGFGIGFDLTSGTTFAVDTISSTGLLGYGMVRVSAGRWRCWIAAAATATSGNPAIYLISGTAFSYAGNTSRGVTIHRHQINRGTGPTSYLQSGGVVRCGLAVDYDPLTKLCKGVLNEPAATNYVPQSAGGRPGFLWGGNASTRVTSAEKDPMGGLEALQVTTTSHGGMNVSNFAGGLTIGQTYTASMWIKGTAGQQQYFTMDSTGLAAMQKLITFTGAWQRAFHTYTATVGTAYIGFETYDRTAGAHLPHTTYHIWGGQYEPGTVATSHIPTLASAVTRNDDFLTMPPTNYSNSVGTWWAEIELKTTASPLRIVGYGDGSTTPISTNGSTAFINFWGAGNVVSPSVASIVGIHKVVTAYQANDAAMTVDGLVPNSQTASNPAALLATPSTIYLGHQGAQPINGWLRKLTYRQRRVSNAEMQTETA